MTLASSRPHCPRSWCSAPKRSASLRTKSSSSRNAPSRSPSQVTTKNAPWPHCSRTFEKQKRKKSQQQLQYSFFIVFISWSSVQLQQVCSHLHYSLQFTFWFFELFPFPRDFSLKNCAFWNPSSFTCFFLHEFWTTWIAAYFYWLCFLLNLVWIQVYKNSQT